MFGAPAPEIRNLVVELQAKCPPVSNNRRRGLKRAYLKGGTFRWWHYRRTLQGYRQRRKLLGSKSWENLCNRCLLMLPSFKHIGWWLTKWHGPRRIEGVCCGKFKSSRWRTPKKVANNYVIKLLQHINKDDKRRNVYRERHILISNSGGYKRSELMYI